jgi:hypothetical protein
MPRRIAELVSESGAPLHRRCDLALSETGTGSAGGSVAVISLRISNVILAGPGRALISLVVTVYTVYILELSQCLS